MDGLKCYFTRLNEVDAWNKAKESDDLYRVLFDEMLTNFDFLFLRKAAIGGVDTRRV